MDIPITVSDVLFAAGFAALIVFVIKIVSRLFYGLITRGVIFSLGAMHLSPEQLEAVMQKCYRLFPIESFLWDGSTFKRGSTLRIVTDRNNTYEGKFMGINADCMLCLVTAECVIAQEIKTITEIQVIA